MRQQGHMLAVRAQLMSIRLHHKALRFRDEHRGEGTVEYLLVLTLIVGLVVLAAFQ